MRKYTGGLQESLQRLHTHPIALCTRESPQRCPVLLAPDDLCVPELWDRTDAHTCTCTCTCTRTPTPTDTRRTISTCTYAYRYACSYRYAYAYAYTCRTSPSSRYGAGAGIGMCPNPTTSHGLADHVTVLVPTLLRGVPEGLTEVPAEDACDSSSGNSSRVPCLPTVRTLSGGLSSRLTHRWGARYGHCGSSVRSRACLTGTTTIRCR